jgi:hypothetical protein
VAVVERQCTPARVPQLKPILPILIAVIRSVSDSELEPKLAQLMIGNRPS